MLALWAAISLGKVTSYDYGFHHYGLLATSLANDRRRLRVPAYVYTVAPMVSPNQTINARSC
jgi:hypothetical protein